MSDTLHTKKQAAQFRGPSTSDNYNERQEDVYKDLVYLANKIGLAEEDVLRNHQREVKEAFSLARTLEDLEARVSTLEAGENRLTFRHSTQIDNYRFIGTDYEINQIDQCYYDSRHGVILLAKLDASSLSKLLFTNSDGSTILPSSFESIARGSSSTADSYNATIDTSDPYHAVLGEPGRIWERNVIVDSPHASGAEVKLYVRIPTDASVTADTNVILVHPFPALGVELIEVAYTTAIDVALSDLDVYTPLNNLEIHTSNTDAIGWVPPGGWSGDTIPDCGPKAFYFDPKTITGLRITLKQNHYYREGSKYIYSYGLSSLDARLDKFREESKTMIRFDAPDGETINSISNVTPEIWNVSEAEAPYVFSHRVVWETSFDSGVYTTNPVPLSNRVWIEVTLTKTINKGTPALSGLTIEYT